MGYGVVGKGVAYAINQYGGRIEKRTGFKLRLLHILDLLDFPDSPDARLITHDVEDVMGDGDVDVVVETMGGLNAAFRFTVSAFERGKHVVTSNKELVAERGPELLKAAAERGVNYLFDASVGGGIPVITPVSECLVAGNIASITGILNGTTNFMLSHMKSHGTSFAETLKLAQEMGYAESDPAADIEGDDARRKLAIISSVAWGAFLDWKTIHTEGIANVTLEDILQATDLGRVLKLVAQSRRLARGGSEAYVLPVMLDRRDPLASVDGVYNALTVGGDLYGDVMFRGQGAGMLPTGGAVVSDIIKAAAPGKRCAALCWDRDAAINISEFSKLIHGFYVRVESPDPDAYRDDFFRRFPEARVLPRYADGGGCDGSAVTPRTVIFMVPSASEGEFIKKIADINAAVAGSTVRFTARLPLTG